MSYIRALIMRSYWLMAVKTGLLIVVLWVSLAETNPYAKRLYEDLLGSGGYNKIIRPVANNSDKIVVTIGLKLSQLIDVDEKNQIMTTNVWVSQNWLDRNLVWDPKKFGHVDHIYVPIENIWHPDIVLYNTADGSYEMTTGTKATVDHTGLVHWSPPASFKSSCTIDVTYFPFDEQFCELRFGSWTYDFNEVDIEHEWQERAVGKDGHQLIESGLDMTNFYDSVEWDVMNATATMSFTHYAGSVMPFREWRFSVALRRKFLFYTVNLIIPLISHAFITVLVFYLPADSRQKITLVISIFLSLTVFFLMLAEIIPSTSIVVPLLGKYLVFTLILVAASVFTTVLIKNLHYRSSATHKMSDWTRKVFLYWMPRLLMMRRPKIENSHDVHLKHIKLKMCPCVESEGERGLYQDENGSRYQFGSKRTRTQTELINLSTELDSMGDATRLSSSGVSPEVERAINGALFIANHLKEEDDNKRTREDWKYVALVIDRVFLWIYGAVCVVGTIGIICQAPQLYDTRASVPLNNTNLTQVHD